MTNGLVWFRRDFRIHDQKALYFASKWAKQNNGKLILMFNLDPIFTEELSLHHQYFFQTVMAFKQKLSSDGIPFVIRFGNPLDVISNMIDTLNIECVFYNRDYVGYGAERDRIIEDYLQTKGIQSYSYDDAHIHHPNEVLKADKTIYKVYTPYYKAWSKLEKEMPYELTSHDLRPLVFENQQDDDASILQRLVDQSTKTWTEITEEEAYKRIKSFVDSTIIRYHRQRDFPSIDGTSRMSAYLKTGVISPRTIFAEILRQQNEVLSEGAEVYVKELAWRDFYHVIDTHHPSCHDEEIDEKYKQLPWNDNHELFESWVQGKTGFPIVDAAMRQLQSEGWMHNRLRMITASFLTKDYLIDWRKGERYFQKMLIDYDRSSNIGGWQWAASVGTDAVPYFRIFNPTTQSQKFDVDGEFIKRYVPELRTLNKSYIHEPSKMSDFDQMINKFELGVDYPHPTVDHKKQRDHVLTFFKEKKLMM